PTSAEGSRIYELQVAPEDVGKVIGRDGRTVNAMRTLLAAAAQRKGEKARLEILDDRRLATRNATPPAVPAAPPASEVRGRAPRSLRWAMWLRRAGCREG